MFRENVYKKYFFLTTELVGVPGNIPKNGKKEQ
jgi:hypothetical protein